MEFVINSLVTYLSLADLPRLAQVSKSIHDAIEQNIDAHLIEEFDSTIMDSYKNFSNGCSKLKFLNVIQLAIMDSLKDYHEAKSDSGKDHRVAKSDRDLIFAFPQDDIYHGKFPQNNIYYGKFPFQIYKSQLLAINSVVAVKRAKWHGNLLNTTLVENIIPFSGVETLEYLFHNSAWGQGIRYYVELNAQAENYDNASGDDLAINFCIVRDRLDLVQWFDAQAVVPKRDNGSYHFPWGNKFNGSMKWYLEHSIHKPVWMIKTLSDVAAREGNYDIVRYIYETHGVIGDYSFGEFLSNQPISTTEWALEENLIKIEHIFSVRICYRRPDILKLVYERFNISSDDISADKMLAEKILKYLPMEHAVAFGNADTINWIRSIGVELNRSDVMTILKRKDLSLIENLSNDDLNPYKIFLIDSPAGVVLDDTHPKFRDPHILYGNDSTVDILQHLAQRGYWPTRHQICQYSCNYSILVDKDVQKWIQDNYWFSESLIGRE